MEVLEHERKKAGEMLASKEAAVQQLLQELEGHRADILQKEALAAEQVSQPLTHL